MSFRVERGISECPHTRHFVAENCQCLAAGCRQACRRASQNDCASSRRACGCVPRSAGRHRVSPNPLIPAETMALGGADVATDPPPNLRETSRPRILLGDDQVSRRPSGGAVACAIVDAPAPPVACRRLPPMEMCRRCLFQAWPSTARPARPSAPLAQSACRAPAPARRCP